MGAAPFSSAPVAAELPKIIGAVAAFPAAVFEPKEIWPKAAGKLFSWALGAGSVAPGFSVWQQAHLTTSALLGA